MNILNVDTHSSEYIDFFCTKYNAISHKELKKINEFQEIRDQNVRDKIYNKVRYNYKRSHSDEVRNINHTHIGVQGKDCIRKFFDFELFFKSTICSGIFLFLANESIHFYKEMGVSNLFSYLLPFLLESSVFFLFLKKDYISKLLLFLVVIFNIVTFSMNTINSDIKNLEIQSIKKEQSLELTAQKLKKEKRISELEGELYVGVVNAFRSSK